MGAVNRAQRTVVVLHTGAVTIPMLKERFMRLLPDVRVVNILDDSLVNDMKMGGGLTPQITKRVSTYCMLAEDMGADVILSACSSMGDAIPIAQTMVSVPIIRVDEPMVEKAVTMGQRIGVIATVRTTLEPTVRLFRCKASEQGRRIEIVERLCEGALELLAAGKAEEHDRVVLEKIRELNSQVDVIVLAQVSIARLIPNIDPDVTVPVLASPDSAVQRVRDVLAGIGV